MTFQHLPHEDITAIHAAALQVGLAGSRDALLAGLDPSYVDGLPTGKSPADQLSRDLDAMNRVERLADGAVPLQHWLATALRLTSIRLEAAVFQRALDALARKPATSPAPLPSAPAGPWGTKLSGAEVEELTSAILAAFPTRPALARMLRLRLDKNLDEIAAPGNLRDTVFEVVTAAEARGEVADLFAAALAENPKNPALVAMDVKRRT